MTIFHLEANSSLNLIIACFSPRKKNQKLRSKAKGSPVQATDSLSWYLTEGTLYVKSIFYRTKGSDWLKIRHLQSRTEIQENKQNNNTKYLPIHIKTQI